MTCFSKNTSLILFQQGWYFAEVQGFEPDDDIISIVYEKEPKRVYQESMTSAISRGEIRLVKYAFYSKGTSSKYFKHSFMDKIINRIDNHPNIAHTNAAIHE